MQANHGGRIEFAVLKEIRAGGRNRVAHDLAASHLSESGDRHLAVTNSEAVVGQVRNERGKNLFDREAPVKVGMVDVIGNDWV